MVTNSFSEKWTKKARVKGKHCLHIGGSISLVFPGGPHCNLSAEHFFCSWQCQTVYIISKEWGNKRRMCGVVRHVTRMKKKAQQIYNVTTYFSILETMSHNIVFNLLLCGGPFLHPKLTLKNSNCYRMEINSTHC